MCSEKAHEVVLFHFLPSSFGQNFPVTATSPPLFEIKHLAVFFFLTGTSLGVFFWSFDGLVCKQFVTQSDNVTQSFNFFFVL